MKFTDGYWLMRNGVRAYYPAQAYDVAATPESLTVYAPTHPIRQRGATLAGPLLTIDFSSPMPDVIRVKLTHFAGQQPKQPQFQIFEDPETDITVSADDAAATLTSGRLTVRVPRGDRWRVEFMADDRVVTSSGYRGMGIIRMDDGSHFMHDQMMLGVGEMVYGLGERFTAFVKNGQAVDIWNRDGGTGSEQAYKNVPFFLTNRGYGVFVNHSENVSFEVASEKVSRVQWSVEGHSLEYFLIYGPTPKEVLAKYTALTGRPALPPPWSFGLWLTTSFTTSQPA